MDDGEIITEVLQAIDEVQQASIELTILPSEPPRSEVLPSMPPSNFVFQKKYLQLFLVVSGAVSGLLLAYDLKNHKSVEPRALLAGFNVFASVMGLSYFAKHQQKKEKVDDEPKQNNSPSK